MKPLRLSTEKHNGPSVCVRGAALLTSAVVGVRKAQTFAVSLLRTVLPLEMVVRGMAMSRNVPLPAFTRSPKGRCFALTPEFPRLRFTACWRA